MSPYESSPNTYLIQLLPQPRQFIFGSSIERVYGDATQVNLLLQRSQFSTRGLQGRFSLSILADGCHW